MIRSRDGSGFVLSNVLGLVLSVLTSRILPSRDNP